MPIKIPLIQLACDLANSQRSVIYIYFFPCKFYPLSDLSFRLESFESANNINGKKKSMYSFENTIPLFDDVETLVFIINFHNVVGHI